MTEHYKSVTELPAEVPIFPLEGTILLPRATLPLNIFEPRYLEMIDWAIRGARVIGIIQPIGDGGATGLPQARNTGLRNVGCAGRITMFQEQDDGRMLIALKGLARFKPRSEVQGSAPYRSVVADYQPFAHDLIPESGAEDVNRERLIETLRHYLEHRRLNADWEAIAAAGTEFLINWLSIASPFAAEEKQALLEAATLKERADTLVALAQMELASGDDGSGNRLQ